MTFEFSRKHLVFFGILLILQVTGVLFMWEKEAGFTDAFIFTLLALSPGSAFLSTVVIMELLKVINRK